MNNCRFKIIAKNNVREAYLMAYAHKNDMGFIADFEKDALSPDALIQSMRKEGVWLDFKCSKRIEKQILKRVASLKAKTDNSAPSP